MRWRAGEGGVGKAHMLCECKGGVQEGVQEGVRHGSVGCVVRKNKKTDEVGGEVATRSGRV